MSIWTLCVHHVNWYLCCTLCAAVGSSHKAECISLCVYLRTVRWCLLCEGGAAKSGAAGPVRGGSNFMQRGTGPYGGMSLMTVSCMLMGTAWIPQLCRSNGDEVCGITTGTGLTHVVLPRGGGRPFAVIPRVPKKNTTVGRFRWRTAIPPRTLSDCLNYR